MKLFDKYHDEKYAKISFYVIKTAAVVFIMGILIYYLSGEAHDFFAFIGSILGPLLLGVALAYLFSPLLEWLENKVLKKIKKEQTRRTLGVVLMYALIILLIVLILMMLIITVTRSISSIDFSHLLDYVASLETDFSSFWSVAEKKLAEYNINLGSFGSFLSKVFNNVSSGVSTLLFANIFAIYFLLDSHIFEYWKDVIETFTSEKTRERLREFYKDADRVFSGYIRGQSIDALLIAVMVSIALLIIGVPYAAVIGLLTGIGNLIPYVGPIIGFASLIVVVLSEGSISHLIAGGITLALVMVIDGNIINPKLLSNNVEIHPVLVVVALLAGGQVGGIMGMLIAVPCAALIKLQFERFVEKRSQANRIQDK